MILSALVLGAGALALHSLCVRPLACHFAQARLEHSSRELLEPRNSWEVPRKARANITKAMACSRVQPSNINFYMIAAFNYRLLGRDAEAVEIYERALLYDRRPEIYAALGNAQSRVGRREQAVQNLLRANIFWPNSLNDIEDPFVHDEVERRYEAYKASLRHRRQ